MQVNIAERSRYVNTTASDVARIWRRHNLVANVVSIVVVVFLAVTFLLLPHPRLVNLLVTLVGYACVCAGQLLYKNREAKEAIKILTHDSDPAKLAQVIDEMLPKVRDRRSRQFLSSAYAVCSVLMGYDDVALAWVSKVEAEAPRDKNLRMSLLSTRAGVAKHRNDTSALAALLEQAHNIEAESRQGTPLEGAANAVISSIERHLAFVEGDYDKVRELNGAIDALATTPQAMVSCEFGKAELEDALGNVRAAWTHYANVANNGGTLLMRSIAQAWLEAHDPRVPARESAPAQADPSGEEPQDADPRS